jgi:hypothetical protein
LLLEIVIIDGGYSFSRAVAGEAPPMWRAANEALQTFIDVALYSSVAFGALTFAQRRDVISAWIESIRTHRWLPWFAAQCALFLVVMMMLPALQNGAARPPWFIFSMWLAASAGLVLCATLSLAPLSFWREQAQRQAGNLLAALIGGASVYAAVTQAKESWRELSAATLSASHWLLSLYEPGAFADAATRTLGARDFQVVIDAPCSGYEGIGLVLGVLGFYLFAFRRELRFPNALVLLPIGAVTIWALLIPPGLLLVVLCRPRSRA